MLNGDRLMTRLSIAVLAIAQTVFAINNVAVLELIPNASVQDEIRIEESRHLTDELRKQAVTALPAKEYSVLTRDNLIALMPLDEKEAECLAESCAVEIGRAIGAEYISQGTIGKFGKKLTISVELYETMGGKFLSSIVFESEDIEGLLKVIRKEAKPLFRSILSKPRLTGLKDYQDSSGKSFNQANQGSDKGSVMQMPQWIGIGLAVAGIGAGIFGFLQDGEFSKQRDAYKNGREGDDFNAIWDKAEKAKSNRNIGYIVGSVLLAGGITVYFVF